MLGTGMGLPCMLGWTRVWREDLERSRSHLPNLTITLWAITWPTQLPTKSTSLRGPLVQRWIHSLDPQSMYPRIVGPGHPGCPTILRHRGFGFPAKATCASNDHPRIDGPPGNHKIRDKNTPRRCYPWVEMILWLSSHVNLESKWPDSFEKVFSWMGYILVFKHGCSTAPTHRVIFSESRDRYTQRGGGGGKRGMSKVKQRHLNYMYKYNKRTNLLKTVLQHQPTPLLQSMYLYILQSKRTKGATVPDRGVQWVPKSRSMNYWTNLSTVFNEDFISWSAYVCIARTSQSSKMGTETCRSVLQSWIASSLLKTANAMTGHHRPYHRSI